MFVRSAAATLSGIVMLLSAPALAQDPDDEIIVEKRIEIDGAAARVQARDITQRQLSDSEPLARFQSPICPGTYGLLEANAQAVIERIYSNAEAAGLEVAVKENCAANVWVIVVDDPATEFEKLEDQSSWMIDGMSKAERNAVKEQAGPVRAWNVTSTRDDNGVRIQTGFGQPPPTVQTYRMSRLHVPIRRDIDGAVVMVARSALADVDAFTLADYATMRALARTKEPHEQGSFDTVLTIFSDDRRADRLTTFDRAYLRSLYLSSAHRPGRMAMASLTKLMEEELNAGQTED